MPGVNGFALTRMARVRQRDIKITYVTSYDLPVQETIGRILRDPIMPETLVSIVRWEHSAEA